ncbi:hypothetical protein C8R46DRAFT_1358707 [Mycena filopes]|nr:hypothetical protein C8R46DRAFT_1358707 [Mycena filopes]
MHHFIKALVRHCSRWETVVLNIPFCDLHLLHADMPLLRVLSLGIMHAEQDAAPVHIFDRAPKLIYVAMQASLSRLLILPWAQPKSLALNTTIPGEVFGVLSLATNLCSLLVDITSASMEAPTNTTMPIHLPRISRLNIHRTDPAPMAQFLDGLTLPNLTFLRISPTYSFPPTIVTDFVVRSQCNLPSLCIDIELSECPEEHWRRLLPTVGEIIVHEVDDPADWLSRPAISDYDSGEEDSDSDPDAPGQQN